MAEIDFSLWKSATGDLPWGVQRVFLDALQAVAEHGTQMVWGADYDVAGMPCLVNTAAPMLAVGGGHGIPSTNFLSVVREFDRINRQFKILGINEGSRVSPLAADFLVRNFGDLKPEPKAEDIAAKVLEKNPTLSPYVEPSDEEFEQHLLTMGTTRAPVEEEDVAERIDGSEAPRL